MTKQKIVDELKKRWGLSSDAALGDSLGVGRQGVYQWIKGKRTEDINTVIITRLLHELDAKHGQ